METSSLRGLAKTKHLRKMRRLRKEETRLRNQMAAQRQAIHDTFEELLPAFPNERIDPFIDHVLDTIDAAMRNESHWLNDREVWA